MGGSDPETIFLTDGASKGVQQVLNALIRNEKDGVFYFLHSNNPIGISVAPSLNRDYLVFLIVNYDMMLLCNDDIL